MISVKGIDIKLLEKYKVNYNRDNRFQLRARLLQSYYRKNILGIERCGRSSNKTEYGNYLTKVDRGKNFLTDNIRTLVENELKDKGNRLISEDRLCYNMLSSQALCFNLFGEFVNDRELCKKVFAELLGVDEVKEVIHIKFEHNLERENNNYTGDRSACDVFIEYEGRKGKSYLGIEVKYHENMSGDQKKEDASFENHKKNYLFFNKKLGIFDVDSLNQLKKLPLVQIWRDHLLCHSFYSPKCTEGIYADYRFIFLYPEQNESCKKVVGSYRELMNNNDDSKSHFRPMTLEIIYGALRKYCNDEWVNEFYRRYLDFKKPFGG